MAPTSAPEPASHGRETAAPTPAPVAAPTATPVPGGGAATTTVRKCGGALGEVGSKPLCCTAHTWHSYLSRSCCSLGRFRVGWKYTVVSGGPTGTRDAG